MTRRTLFAAIAAGIMGLASHGPAFAQDGDVRIVVPTLPGGATDTVGRMLGEQLSRTLGRNVIIDNKAGAGASLGTADVAASEADGNTLLFTMSGPLTTVPHVITTLDYEIQDFEPIAVAFRAPFLVVVKSGSPYETFHQLIEAGRPGGENPPPAYGSSGVGTMSNIASEMLNRSAGTEFLHVPFQGGAATLQALQTGEVAWALITTQDGKSALQSGQLRPLAIFADERSPHNPDVPTIAELGYEPVNLDVWWSLYAPAGIPEEVGDTLRSAVMEIVGDESYAERINQLGGQVPSEEMSSEEILQALQSESDDVQSIVETLDMGN